MTDHPHLRRRTLVKGIAAASLLPLLGGNLVGCSDGSDAPPLPEGVAADFNHGVASGDPLTDRVIIWTRVTPREPGFVTVDWEVASDEGFANLVASGRGNTDETVDFTLKADVTGLAAGTTYFYRFRVREVLSSVGRTRTAPAGATATAAFAVVSCSNYPAGYFNVYREVAAQPVDAVLHLGDYIYEYAPGGYASANAEALGRVVQPAGELTPTCRQRTAPTPSLSSGTITRLPMMPGGRARRIMIRRPRANIQTGVPPRYRPGMNGYRCVPLRVNRRSFTGDCLTVICWT